MEYLQKRMQLMVTEVMGNWQTDGRKVLGQLQTWPHSHFATTSLCGLGRQVV